MKQLIIFGLGLGAVAFLTFLAQGCGRSKTSGVTYPDTTVTAIRYAERQDSNVYVGVKDERAFRILSEGESEVVIQTNGKKKILESQKSLDTNYFVWHRVYADSAFKSWSPDSTKQFFRPTNTWIQLNKSFLLLDYYRDFNSKSHHYSLVN